jgi:hypothetical protein
MQKMSEMGVGALGNNFFLWRWLVAKDIREKCG